MALPSGLRRAMVEYVDESEKTARGLEDFAFGLDLDGSPKAFF